MLKRLSMKSGVTLLEVLVAMGIVALVVGATSQGTAFLSRKLVEGRLAQTARALAQQKLAELEASTLVKGNFAGDFGDDFPRFTYRLAVDSANSRDVSIPGLFDVRLTVEWNDSYATDSLGLETFLAEYPSDAETE